MFESEDRSVRDWTNYTLIIPSVSVGNVGQLSADLLISTLSPNLAGYLYTDTVLPIVGNDPFATCETLNRCRITTAVQVYESLQHKLVIVQQRAPYVKGKSREFVEMLMSWIEKCRFKQIMLMSSMFAHERRDAQLTGVQTRYLATEKASAVVDLAQAFAALQLEQRPSKDLQMSAQDSRHPFIPGGGIAKDFFVKCCEADVAAVVLLIFCDEGDNIHDAITLASYVNRWLNIIHVPSDEECRTWKIPSSWKLLFGNHFDQSIF